MKYLHLVYTLLTLSGLILSPISVNIIATPSSPIHGPPVLRQSPHPSANVTHEFPTQPGINDNISVSATVSSPAGVDPNKIRLIYSYRNKGISGNLSMSGNSSGFLPTTFSSITAISSNQKEANYTYVSNFIDRVNITLNTEGGGNPRFISYIYSYLDIATSSWIDLGAEVGIANKTLYFYHTGVISGFKFSVIVERSGKVPDDPTFDASSIIESYNTYTATIPAPGLSTAIDYYVQASDLDSSVFFSKNETVYSNTRPSLVSYNDVPIVIPHDKPFLLNITARDPDGFTQLSDVEAYYQASNDTTWYQTRLSFNHGLNSTDAIFTGSLNITNLPASEGNMEIYLNITDSVDGIKQLPVKSYSTSVFLDSQGPILQQPISIYANPLITNTTGINSRIMLNMTFVDSNGIKSADIIYSMDNGTIRTAPLLNSTIVQQSSTSASYSFIFPQFTQSTNISFYFETEDFVGNVFTSAVYHLSIDGKGPVLVNQDILVRNEQQLSIQVLYNTWDPSGLKSQRVYYQYQNDTSWQIVNPSTINYNKYIDQQETFELIPKPPAKDIGSIYDNNITLFTLPITPSFSPQNAIVDIELTHQRLSDLQIYLIYLGTRYLISDRQNNSSIIFSLMDYLSLPTLTSENLTIEVHDTVEGGTGVMNSISLRLFSYTIPFGFTYMVELPTPTYDTTILYYMTLEDNLGNQRNTTIFDVAFVTISPTISDLTEYSGIVDANGLGLLPVTLTVADSSLINSVSLYYKYAETEAWSTGKMIVDSGMVYNGKLPLKNYNGTLFYQVEVTGTNGKTIKSKMFEFRYFNANGGITLLTDIRNPFDLSGGNSLRLDVQVTSGFNITGVQIVYKINGGQENNGTMGKVSTNRFAYFVIINAQEGKIEFFFIGMVGDHDVITPVYSLSFINSGDPANLLPYVAVGGVAIISTGYAVIKKMKKKSHISHRKPLTLDH